MPAITAEYTSPTATSPHNISQPLPSISASPSTDDRVAYLAEMQKAVKLLQDDVNVFLTQKMDEDKAGSGNGNGNGKADDAQAEDYYGEEVVDEE
jgi:hypothetical protein